jgi:predicted MPP superfamily phosphohydrolase
MAGRTDILNILHLSDLHFGAECNLKILETALALRKSTLDGIFDLFPKFGPDWNPDIIVISGDIGWKGNEKNYNESDAWLRKLLNSLKLNSNDLIICPGNHDIDRDRTTGMEPPISSDCADDWLSVENLDNFLRPFSDFAKFCEQFNTEKLKIGTRNFNFIGTKEHKGVRFIVLNSAWFSRSDNDSGRLWIGQPQLRLMSASNQIVDTKTYDEEMITIAVMHHPSAWLHHEEQSSFKLRPGTYGYLAQRCHIILSGHSHSMIDFADRIRNRAYFFSVGATYAGSYYSNNFALLQVNLRNRTVIRRAFEFDPSRPEWVEKKGFDTDPYFLTKSPAEIRKGIP